VASFAFFSSFPFFLETKVGRSVSPNFFLSSLHSSAAPLEAEEELGSLTPFFT